MKANLSVGETLLYGYIMGKFKGATINDIETDLDAKILGCLGRLLKEGLIEKIKIKEGEHYGAKSVVYYKIKETKEE